MRSATICALSLVTSALIGVAAQASDAGTPAGAPTAATVYEGVDARGHLVRVRISDVSVETLERVSPTPSRHYPGLHWSARFGTGQASVHETAAE
jgi:hypothetical protein